MGNVARTAALAPPDRDRVANFIREGGTFCARLPPFSAIALLAHHLHREAARAMVWITDGPRTLDAFHQDLLTLGADPETLLLYPAWESLPGHGAPPTPDLLGQRLDALQRCLHAEQPLLIATCIQAVRQRTLSAAALRRFSPLLRAGRDLDLQPLMVALEQAGYEIGAEVQTRGQATFRGGIVDVWPTGAPWPVRIELFGSQIESLRTFDPADQRSLDPLEEFRLAPATEGDLAGCLLDVLPPEAGWALVDADRIRQHEELFDELVREARAEASTVPGRQVHQLIEASSHRLELRLVEAAGAHHFDLEPVAGVALGGGSVPLDVVERARRQFVEALREKLAEGWSVEAFFSTPGARERFAETESELVASPRCALRDGALSEGFACPGLRRLVLTEGDLYGSRKQARGRPAAPRRRAAAQTPAQRIADWTELLPGDLVVHVDHGIGKYLGLYELEFNGQRQEVLSIEYAEKARLHLPVSQTHLLSRYIGVGKRRPELHALGGKRWQREKTATARAVEDLASILLKTQAARDALPGHAFAKDTPWQAEFEAAFPYQETPDQEQAIQEVKRDMESSRPMDRLVCGDVGYGKTEVAMRAAFKAVMDGRQAAVLVPTTILAQQHFDTFCARMAAYPVRIAVLSRFQTAAEQEEIVQRLGEGTLDIVIGTHRLVQADVRFKDLGLVVIDEEQRFGVKHKEHLKTMRQLVDVLTLTATPIPRTLYLSLTGARDLSTIETPPVERLPIETVVAENTDEVVREAILRELNREGQIYFLHNRVHSIEHVRERLAKLVPEARVEVAHGQMPERQLAAIMRAFVRADFDVLLCTTIIESGLDIPNVNTILIDRADRFGLADLYQLRGRVGRYKRKAYAYLLLPRHGRLFDTARKRIGAIKRYSHLGAGFKLALQDLEIRGSGNILGSEQSGFITAVGFDLYCQLLRRSIAHLKGEPMPPLIDVETRLDFLSLSPATWAQEGSAVIPTAYVEDESLRVSLYRRLASAATPQEVEDLRAELRDRFGKLPPAVDRLLKLARLRIEASRRQIRSIETQDDKVLITRRGDLVTVANRLPRLSARNPAAKLDELIKLVRSLAPDP